uniref:RNA-directed DNA polymerase n=1 Tax=Anopheles darlingi TaxID=43151 RepID=A0A2M4CKM2_ANODA
MEQITEDAISVTRPSNAGKKKERENTQLDQTSKNGAFRVQAKKREPELAMAKDSKWNVRCHNCRENGHVAYQCPKRTEPPRCYTCGAPGHRARECPKKTIAENNVIAANERGGIVNMKIGGRPVNALFDTGSQYNMILEEILETIGEPVVVPTEMCFLGFGGIRTKALGRITTTVCIGPEVMEMMFYVVPRDSMGYEAILGREVLSEVEARVTQERVELVRRKVDEIEPTAETLLCMEEEITVPTKYRKTISDLISNCVPDKTKQFESCPVELKIVPDGQLIPCRDTPRQLAHSEEKAVDQQVEEWLQQGIVRESTSDFASKVVVVKKKDGSSRVCVDYRKLNAGVLKDGFPVPIVEEVLNKLQKAKWFTVMDLANGFFHVPVEEESKKYTAFATKKGLFEFNRAPFGFCNSPAAFIRFVNYVFRDLLKENMLDLYMDDIVVHGETDIECLEKTKKVLETAAKAGLAVKWKKCLFLQQTITFLGHLVENGRVSPGIEKVKAVKNFRVPKNVKGIQAFLGLTGFFRKFIKGYAEIARPLTDLLRKDSRFEITERELSAFNELKEQLIKEPVLRIFEQGAKTELHTDASKIGFGGVLMQWCDEKLHPVYFWSKKTTESESQKHSYILEAKAVFLAVKKFRRYLLGVPFKLVTDCNAFKQTLRKADVPNEVLPWVMYLQDFNFEVEHRPGTRLRHVDCLSRYPLRVMVVTSEITARIKNGQQKDEMVKAICEILGERAYGAYHLKGGILYYAKDGQDLVVVPRGMQRQLIQEVHNNGHFGSQKTIHALMQQYWIPQIEQKVKQTIENCVRCILYNKKLGRKEGYLHPIGKGDKPLHTLHIDHVGPMDATSKQYRYILTMVDGFSKFVWLYPTKTTSAEEALRKLEGWSSVFGNAERVVTDRGAAFTAHAFSEYMRINGIEHVVCTTGVPRGNGQAERVNRTLINMLAKLSIEEPSKWFKDVPRVQRAINAHQNATTGKSPFELMFGVRMKNVTDNRLGEMLQQELYEEYEHDRRELREEAKRAIEEAQTGYKADFDRKRKPQVGYATGDLVAIKRTQFVAGKKLASEFLGPYEVIKVNRNGRYKVKRVAEGEGPLITSTSEDNMKLWRYVETHAEGLSDEEEEV